MEVKQELQLEDSDHAMDIEDAEEVMADCFYFILSVIEQESASPEIVTEGLQLLGRLSEGLNWETMH